MYKMTTNVMKIFRDEKQYLTLVASILIMIPIVYFVYLGMSAYNINLSISELLQSNDFESINLIANFTSFYSAYVLLKYRDTLNSKKGFIAFGFIFIAQILLMNQIVIAAMIYYLYHFVGISKIPAYYRSLEKSKNIKLLTCAIFAFIVSVAVLLLKIKMGLI